MAYKIAHFGDSHVHLLKYHEEYRILFQQMFSKLREQKPDLIVHGGDIFHNKTSLSPESVQLVSYFLSNLADIAPLYIIPGNHDTILKNKFRLDAITPVIEGLRHPKITYLKKSQEVKIDDNLTLNALSISDREGWILEPSNKQNINIALYHGSVQGAETDIGYKLEHTDDQISIFDNFDYVFMADIHKTNQSIDKSGKKRYCGSTIQQNYGETDDKGYLLWNIESKDEYTCEHIPFKNPKPFITIEFESDSSIEDVEIPESARIRILFKKHISGAEIKKVIDVINFKYKPESVGYITKTNSKNKQTFLEEELDYENENLRDESVQQKLIKEYLEEFSPSESILNRVFDLNKKYSSLVEQTEDVARNVKWSIKSLEWDNLFNYGKNNKIDFSNLNGVVGVVGGNATGKSSVVNSLLWTQQNSIAKGAKKNVDIINQNCSYGSGKLELKVDNKIYTIERRAEKYIKKLNNEETEEAKTDVNFSVCEENKEQDCFTVENGNLNGLDRNETDKNIRRMFGTIDDFLLTSMTSQTGALTFIDQGSTKRKEILGKFLDLDIFAKKFKLVSDDMSDIKSSLKRLEGRDYDKEIQDTEEHLKNNESLISKNKRSCSLLKEEISKLKEKIQNIDIEIASLPKMNIVDIIEANEKLSDIDSKKLSLEKDMQQLLQKNKDTEVMLSKLNSVISDLNVEDLNEKKKLLQSKRKELDSVLRECASHKSSLEKIERDVAILSEVPCGTTYPTCKFLVNANHSKEIKSSEEELYNISKNKKQGIEKDIEQYSDLEENLDKFNRTLDEKKKFESFISENSLKIEKNKNKILILQKDKEVLENNIKDYYINEESAKKIKLLNSEKEIFQKEYKEKDKELENCDKNLVSFYKDIGMLQQKIENLSSLKNELNNLREQNSALFLYEKCMHSNGISFNVIKKKLPIINEEISKILTNFVDFEIYFEDDGKKLEIYIKYPKYEPRIIELGSGAEQNIAAIAIRLALIKVGTLPVSDLFILDEFGSFFDETNMEGFVRMIEMLKTQFKTIIIISHLDVLKDVVDKHITIEKVNGYAHIEV